MQPVQVDFSDLDFEEVPHEAEAHERVKLNVPAADIEEVVDGRDDPIGGAVLAEIHRAPPGPIEMSIVQ